MIRVLHQHLGISADVLIQGGGELPPVPNGIDLDRFPVAAMARLEYIPRVPNPKDRIEEIVNELVYRAGGRNALPRALFCQGAGTRNNAKTDIHSLQAWRLHVLCNARRAKLEGKYVPGTIDRSFLRDLVRQTKHDEGPRHAEEELASHGIAFVVAKHLPKTYLDGATLRTVEGAPVVGMTLRHDRLDNSWFCLLHELAHLGCHFPDDGTKVFNDDLELHELNNERDGKREQEADNRVQAALIPCAIWERESGNGGNWTVQRVISLAHEADVYHAIVAGRFRHEQANFCLLSPFVGRNEVRRHFE